MHNLLISVYIEKKNWIYNEADGINTLLRYLGTIFIFMAIKVSEVKRELFFWLKLDIPISNRGGISPIYNYYNYKQYIIIFIFPFALLSEILISAISLTNKIACVSRGNFLACDIYFSPCWFISYSSCWHCNVKNPISR